MTRWYFPAVAVQRHPPQRSRSNGAVRNALSSLVALLAVPISLVSQAPLSTWHEFILPTSGLGVGNAIIELRGGGFATVGYADAGRDTGTDILLIRFDENGDTLWTRSYGGDGEDFGWDIVESRDGGFFIVGFTRPTNADHEDVQVLRVDTSGGLLWERTFGGAGRDRAWSATLTADGGLVVAAETEPAGLEDRDAYLIRITSDGEARWVRTIDVPGDQRVFEVARAADGAFVVVGTTATNRGANRDVYVVRVDAGGNLVWTRTYGGAPDDVGHGVVALSGGEVLVTGYGGTRSNGSNDVYLIRLKTDGSLRWWQHWGGPGDDRAMMSTARAAGGYVTVGYLVTAAGADVVILESDPDGNVQARTILERPGDDRGVMVAAPRGGGYVVVGTLGSSRASTGDFAVLWLARDRTPASNRSR